MSIVDDVLKGSNIFTGLAVGLGAVILAPVVIPIVAGMSKPLAKAAIKGGIIFYEKGKEALAEMSEVVDDLVAEAKAEMKQQAEATKAAAATAAAVVGEESEKLSPAAEGENLA